MVERRELDGRERSLYQGDRLTGRSAFKEYMGRQVSPININAAQYLGSG
jgi:hypothetical protein